MAAKSPITCHVLDTLTGQPAPGMAVQLAIIEAPSAAEVNFTATTNSDGRVTQWTSKTGQTVEEILETYGNKSDATIWALRFDTGSYYGEGKTFWPQVELRFFVKGGEHYHVPLLLGPYSYTTYRGS